MQKRLDGVSEIYLERGTTTFPILSQNQFYEIMSKKYGPLIKTTQLLATQSNSDNDNNVNEKTKSLRDDFLNVMDPYILTME